jgi:hypothetical protein
MSDTVSTMNRTSTQPVGKAYRPPHTRKVAYRKPAQRQPSRYQQVTTSGAQFPALPSKNRDKLISLVLPLNTSWNNPMQPHVSHPINIPMPEPRPIIKSDKHMTALYTRLNQIKDRVYNHDYEVWVTHYEQYLTVGHEMALRNIYLEDMPYEDFCYIMYVYSTKQHSRKQYRDIYA